METIKSGTVDDIIDILRVFSIELTLSGVSLKDFAYFHDHVPIAGKDPVSSKKPEVELSFNSIREHLFTTMGCARHLRILENVRDNFPDANLKSKFEKQIELYKRFYDYAIRNMLETIHNLYYINETGKKSTLKLSEAVDLAKKIYDSNLSIFNEFVNTIYKETDLVKKLKHEVGLRR